MSEYNTRFYIGGKLVEPFTDKTFRTEDPATGRVLAEIPSGNKADVDQAVAAAQKAFNDRWKNTDPVERSRILERIADIYRENADELAAIEVRNNGSTYSSMAGDVGKAADRLEYFAGLTREIKGETTEVKGNVVNYTLKEPYGVVAGIIPFNHPLSFIGSKIGPALAAGNSIVLKPSEYTPLSALTLAKYLADDDEIPEGVVNIVTGEGETGAYLSGHGDVNMISFIGSVETGKQIMKSAAERIAPVHLELGGKNPVIVFPDADLERSVDGCIGAMNLAWQGQSCASGSRQFVHEDLHDEFVKGLKKRYESIKVGPPTADSTDMGAIVSKSQYEKILNYIKIGKESDASLVTGGELVTVEGHDGYYVEPTIFDDVDPDSRIAQEEIFGPIVSVIEWSDYDEMIEDANNVKYGLTASIWTNNLRNAMETANNLESGYIWVNRHGTHYMGASKTGYKQSAMGHSHSRQEILEHMQTKTVTVDLDGTEWDGISQ